MVQVETVIKRAAIIPSSVFEQNTSLGEIDLDQEISWSRTRLQLSTEEELESQKQEAQRRASQVQPTSTTGASARNENEQGSEANRSANDNAAAGMGGGDGSFVFVFPDETTLEDYPDAHIMDDSSDVEHPVVVEENEQGEVTAKFERNHVKVDAFHGMQAYKKTTKKNHGVADYFSGALRDAIFMADPDAIEEARVQLSEKLYGEEKSQYHLDREGADKEAKRRLYCPSSKVLRDIPRRIPEPALLEERVQRVINTCANVKDAKTGEIFFSKETWKVHNNFLKKIRAGTVSDMPDFDYYYTTTNASGNQTLWCIRGTSQLEGFHKHLRHIFPGFHTSSLLSTLLLAMFVYRWNIDRAVERGLLSEQYGGWYSHQVLHELQDLSAMVSETPEYGDFPRIHDYKSTGENFFTPIVQSMPRPELDETLNENESDLCDDLSPGMEFSAERDSSVLPYTPVLRCEKAGILEVIAECSATETARSVNQHSQCDFESAAASWNQKCLAEMEKPFEQRKTMFLKTASMIQTFCNQHQGELNAKATARQQIMVDRGNGLKETVILGREMMRVQHQHQEECLPVRQPIAMPVPQLPAASSGDRVRLPPPEVAGQFRRSDPNMAVIERGDHLVNRTAKPTKSKRCYRCGLEKIGQSHQGGVTTTSQEYCSSERKQAGWLAPPGYAVNDQRPKWKFAQILDWWKARKEEEGVVDEFAFDRWD